MKELIDIEDLLVQGIDCDTIAQVVGVPIDWVIGVDLELRGITQYQYQDD